MTPTFWLQQIRLFDLPLPISTAASRRNVACALDIADHIVVWSAHVGRTILHVQSSLQLTQPHRLLRAAKDLLCSQPQ